MPNTKPNPEPPYLCRMPKAFENVTFDDLPPGLQEKVLDAQMKADRG